MSLDLKAYQPRAIAVRLVPKSQAPEAKKMVVASAPIELPFNLDGISTDRDRGDGDFDGRHHTLAGEQLPAQLDLDGVPYTFGSTATGAKNVLVPKGQRLALPAGSFNRVYVLAAAVDGDVPLMFGTKTVTVREWQGPVGQWDSRLKSPSALHEPFVPAPRPNQSGAPAVSTTPSQQEIRSGLVVNWDPETQSVTGIDQIRPGFVKRDEIAWLGTHRHAPEGNQIYVASYIFKYAIDVPAGAKELLLPSNDHVRILAATAVNEPAHLAAAGPLYAVDLKDPAPRR
jgi:alpha-mannosidase